MIILEEDRKILKYNQDKNSFKAPFIISANTELLLEKNYACDKNPAESFKTKTNRRCVAIHYSQTAHLIAAKKNTIFTEELTA